MSDQNGFNSIVPDQDERIGQRRTAPASKPARESRGASGGAGSGGGLWKFLVLVLVLAVGAVGWFGWQQYQQLNQLQASFDSLTDKLASTDDSVSKSGAALQLKIGEQQEELKKHWSEIRKLWGISYDKNKKQIETNKSSASSNTKRINKLEKTAATVGAISKQLDADRKKIAEMSSNSLAVSVEVEDVQQRLQDTSDKLNTVEQTLNRWHSDIGGRLTKNEEAVEAIDTFRRQINRELQQLRKQLSSIRASAPAPTGSTPPAAPIQS